jgi:hypothetical protein
MSKPVIKGLSDRQQTILTIIADVLMAFGSIDTAVVLIKNYPELDLIFGIASVIGGGLVRAIKEIEGTPPTTP